VHAGAGGVAEEPAIDPQSPARFINRELSWLGFNLRVLEEARNPRHPLLERLRFHSISANNLDEFFMVRVAGLAGQIREGVAEISQDGLTAAEQLERIRAVAQELMTEQDRRWDELRRRSPGEGIVIVEPDELTDADRAFLDERFLNQILLIVTPIAIDPAHPFPFIPNRGFCLALELRRRSDGQRMNALLPISHQLERFTRLPAGATARAPASCRSRRRCRSTPRGCFPATTSRARACSGCCATATSRSRRRPRTWCACSSAR
jgi:polyphosphate kinase